MLAIRRYLLTTLAFYVGIRLQHMNIALVLVINFRNTA